MHQFTQAIWGHIWKFTVEKSQNATNVTTHPLMQVIWEHIWKRTVEKNQTNAASVIMPAPTQVLLEDIWRGTMKKGEKWLLPRTHIKDLESYNSNMSSFTFGWNDSFVIWGIKHDQGDPNLVGKHRKTKQTGRKRTSLDSMVLGHSWWMNIPPSSVSIGRVQGFEKIRENTW